MPAAPLPPAPPSSSTPSSRAAADSRVASDLRYLRSKARRDQVLASAVGAVLLSAAMLLQPVLSSRRAAMIEEPEASLRALAINFPRLTLGGFRGLLATVLWYQAENDKEDRKWMDLETKYDIIGAIEPYFVSIYVFHSWNQAYNLSAQWHSEDSKYKWILDGMSYLYKGEQYNPDNPDLIDEEGNLYFLKLGGAFERIFFRAHWRDDLASLYKLDTIKPDEKTDATEALRLVRDFANRSPFNIQEMRNKAGVKGHGVQITDPWLFEFRKDNKAPSEPVEFPYGLSPFYFGYVEFKRSLAAGPTTTVGANIVDGWPPMCLRLWCRDDLYYSGETMMRMFSDSPTNPDQNPLDSTSKFFDPMLFNNKVEEIRLCYRNIDMIAPKAVDLFQKDMIKYPQNKSVHVNHVAETESYRDIALAENELFNALVNWNNGGRKMTEKDKEPFKHALGAYDKAIATTYVWVDKMYPVITNPQTGQAYVNPDRNDFERYVNALKIRKTGIENMLSTPPTEKPDMSFLQEEVVER
ncbi:MAG TPA: hypothetical protein VM008_02110 [Phycisphaerae bacterium]|nr:hypothetical protein [Phycisphaerae bacterium]